MLRILVCVLTAAITPLRVHGQPSRRGLDKAGGHWWTEANIWDDSDSPARAEVGDLPDFTFVPGQFATLASDGQPEVPATSDLNPASQSPYSIVSIPASSLELTDAPAITNSPDSTGTTASLADGPSTPTSQATSSGGAALRPIAPTTSSLLLTGTTSSVLSSTVTSTTTITTRTTLREQPSDDLIIPIIDSSSWLASISSSTHISTPLVTPTPSSIPITSVISISTHMTTPIVTDGSTNTLVHTSTPIPTRTSTPINTPVSTSIPIPTSTSTHTSSTPRSTTARLTSPRLTTSVVPIGNTSPASAELSTSIELSTISSFATSSPSESVTVPTTRSTLVTSIRSTTTVHTSSLVSTTRSTASSSVLSTASVSSTIVTTSTTSIVLPTTISATTSSPQTTKTASAKAGFVNAAYFVNWGTYARNYYPDQLPVDQLTHVFYAFAVQQANGTVTSSDPVKDAICVQQFRTIKGNNPDLKVILSIGGWNASQDGSFSTLASTDATRYVFASSAVALMQSYGFDGIDIDWEYPETAEDAANFVLLLKEVRSALDILGAGYGGHHFLLTVASPAGPSHYKLWQLSDMIQYLDYFNFMGYDYMGAGFSAVSGHQANLYKSSTNSASTDYETESAIDDYIRAGIPPSMLVLGMPAYGRSFDNTALGEAYTMPTQGSWVDASTGDGVGIWDYKSLPKAGATEHYAIDAGAYYSYDPDTRELISYDTAAMVAKKLAYVLSMGLGGAYYWEASADRTDDLSLIATSASIFRNAGGLDDSPSQQFSG